MIPKYPIVYLPKGHSRFKRDDVRIFSMSGTHAGTKCEVIESRALRLPFCLKMGCPLLQHNHPVNAVSVGSINLPRLVGGVISFTIYICMFNPTQSSSS